MGRMGLLFRLCVGVACFAAGDEDVLASIEAMSQELADISGAGRRAQAQRNTLSRLLDSEAALSAELATRRETLAGEATAPSTDAEVAQIVRDAADAEALAESAAEAALDGLRARLVAMNGTERISLRAEREALDGELVAAKTASEASKDEHDKDETLQVSALLDRFPLSNADGSLNATTLYLAFKSAFLRSDFKKADDKFFERTKSRRDVWLASAFARLRGALGDGAWADRLDWVTGLTCDEVGLAAAQSAWHAVEIYRNLTKTIRDDADLPKWLRDHVDRVVVCVVAAPVEIVAFICMWRLFRFFFAAAVAAACAPFKLLRCASRRLWLAAVFLVSASKNALAALNVRRRQRRPRGAEHVAASTDSLGDAVTESVDPVAEEERAEAMSRGILEQIIDVVSAGPAAADVPAAANDDAHVETAAVTKNTLAQIVDAVVDAVGAAVPPGAGAAPAEAAAPASAPQGALPRPARPISARPPRSAHGEDEAEQTSPTAVDVAFDKRPWTLVNHGLYRRE
ncbi:hypothetical protein M885DRAFT_618229 [Pelagophyceae sp. CCMP2097]|nr:hypothetical protein M885DRAFT_618229 [Pelagophyceae sp. CCMP2097]